MLRNEFTLWHVLKFYPCFRLDECREKRIHSGLCSSARSQKDSVFNTIYIISLKKYSVISMEAVTRLRHFEARHPS